MANTGILFLTHKLNLSGAAMHMVTLGRGLQELGCSVAVATGETQPGTHLGKEFWEEAGFTIYEVDFPVSRFNLEWLKTSHEAIASLRSVIDDFKPAIVHVHAGTLCGVARFAAGRTPYVTTFNIQSISKAKQRIARYANKIFGNPFGDAVFAISNEMEIMLNRDMGIPSQVIHRFPYAVDESRFSPPSLGDEQAARAKYSIGAETFCISMIAILDPRKNHALLFDALGILKRRGTEVQALLAGEGKPGQRESLVALAKRVDIADQIHFVGFQPSQDIIWASNVMVLPSLEEGFGLVAIEAMLCERPVIRTPSAGAKEQIVEGETGYIIPFDSPDVLADRIEILCGDSQLCKRMGRSSREHVLRNFRKGLMAEAILRVYRSVLRNG